MRLAIWLALPMGVLIAIAGISVIVDMATGADACGTWLGVIIPYCH